MPSCLNSSWKTSAEPKGGFLRQFAIVKLATCTSYLDLLEVAMHNFRTKVVQTLANQEALERSVGVGEDVLVYVGLTEVRADLHKTNEEISIVRGN